MRPQSSPPVGAHATTALAVALGAGVIGAIQPKLNAELGDRLGSAMVASLVNFVVACVASLVLVAFRPGTRRTLRDLRHWPVPRWTLTAGLGGNIVVIAGAVSVGTIGVSVFSVAFFAGQIAGGLLVDRIGVTGVRHRGGGARLPAAVIAMVAVVVTQIGRPGGEFAPGLVAFVVFAGGCSAVQAAFNGRITRSVGDPYAATAVNTTVGTMALGTLVLILAATGALPSLDWPDQPALYLGGLLGMTIVLSLAIASAAIGVLRTTLAMLAAQLIAALVIDWTVRHDPPTPGVLVGAALIVVAVTLVARARSTAVE